MAFTLDDFDKIWASTSPLTPYEFSDSNYAQGWNFVGSTPPARQMWDFLQKRNDEKTQWLYNNKLSLSGGTMTGTLTLGGFPAIKNTNNTSNIIVAGGSSTAASDGAKLILTGADNTDAGAWTVQAGNSGGYKQLVGKATGEFTWGGSNVAVMGTLQSGHGILTGYQNNISVPANSYVQGTIDFGQTFSSVPMVVVCGGMGHAHIHASCSNITTTKFTYTVSSEGPDFTNERVNWIAIG